MSRKILLCICICLCSLLPYHSALSQEQTSILNDINGDGKISVAAFGDSITFGVGDNGLLPDATQKGGWPNRTEVLLGVLFNNEGIPGELLTEGGYLRFPNTLAKESTDFVVIFEGANDSNKSISPSVFRTSLQRMINSARALGRIPVLATLPSPCCDHLYQSYVTDLYSGEIKLAATSNDLVVADVKQAWETTCQNRTECELYNLPDGLHPNARGYDVISQVFAAAFLGIDIFAPEGAATLEAALGLAPGTVLVKPAPVTSGV